MLIVTIWGIIAATMCMTAMACDESDKAPSYAAMFAVSVCAAVLLILAKNW